MLFAALIAPWFIDWDDYKANFEAEAEKVLGHPVRVDGSADASILPSPSLTFTDVKVGDVEGQPMMTIEKFAVTIELLPLLQGEIKVISMQLDRPVVRVSVDDTGQIDWLLRSSELAALDPDSVVLNGVNISDGQLIYDDAGSGSSVTVNDIRVGIEARSLAGPWRIAGSYATDGAPVQFSVSTGRQNNDGSLRVKFSAEPGQWPISIDADGDVSLSAAGPVYDGTYNILQFKAPEEGDVGDAVGWRSEGGFVLTRDRLLVEQAVLSEGPPDRPSSLAGSLIVDLGGEPRFEATIQARQLDLDRSLGSGPSDPIEVGAAADEFVAWLSGIPVPEMAGRVRFNVPGIVVGGNVIRDVRFNATPVDHGWLIEGLQARLPGQAIFLADGRLSTGENVGFGGNVSLSVGQPATFAGWWQGRSQTGVSRLLAPFDLSGRATVNRDSIAVEDMETIIDNARVTGSFAWSNGTVGSPERRLRTDLRASRLDFVQIRALAELLGGRDLGETTSIADSYEIVLSSDELIIDDIAMRDVSIDAAYEDGNLTVSGINVGDIGGARLQVTRGQITNILTEPLGRLEGQLSADTLTGVARIVDRLAPDTGFSRWLNQAAPALAPAAVKLEVDSRLADDGSTASTLAVTGSANASTFEAKVAFAGPPSEWRDNTGSFAASVKSYDAVMVARQVGLEPLDLDLGSAQFRVTAEGIPSAGLDTEFRGNYAGLDVASAGTLILPADLPAKYSGTFAVESGDVAPLFQMVGLAIPGMSLNTPVNLSGAVEGLGRSARFEWQNGTVADRRLSGMVQLAEGPAGGLRIDDGALQIDRIDAGWIASLGLGYPPRPTGDPNAPWPSDPFGEPALPDFIAKLTVAAEHVAITDRLGITDAALAINMGPGRLDFDVQKGMLIGGRVVGGLSIRNVAGNANVGGRLSLIGGALDSIVWTRSGRAVGTGTLDFTTDFEATGRSPAGLISSLTGGGTIDVHNGVARYINPRAANLVIRASDRGQPFEEEELKSAFADFMDADSLNFTEAGAPFSIAAGTIRIQNMTVQTEETRASGSAAIDLNDMTIDSDWTVTLDPGDIDDFEGPPPQVGLVFSGPLAAPVRTFDVLQFNSFLNIRQEERLERILVLEQEARLERERLNRLRRKIEQDRVRAERQAEVARLARTDAARAIEQMHNNRTVAAAAYQDAAREAWWAKAIADADAKASARAVAEEAEEAAVQARAEAEAARAVAVERQATLVALRETRDEIAAGHQGSDAARGEAENVLAVQIGVLENAEERRAGADEAVVAAEAELEQVTVAYNAALDEAERLREVAEAALREAAEAEQAAADAEAEVLQSTAELTGLEGDIEKRLEDVDIATMQRDEAAAELDRLIKVEEVTGQNAADAEARHAEVVAVSGSLQEAAEAAQAGAGAAAGAAEQAAQFLDEAETEAAEARDAEARARQELRAAESRLEATRSRLEEARREVEQFEAGENTDTDPLGLTPKAAGLEEARSLIPGLEVAVTDAEAVVIEAESVVEEARAAAEAKVTELTGARTYNENALRDMDAAEEQARIAEDEARAAAAETALAAAEARAKQGAAENAAEETVAARELLQQREDQLADAEQALEAARAGEGDETERLAGLREDAASARERATVARSEADQAVAERNAAEADLAEAEATREAAAERLVDAEGRADLAAEAVEQALAERDAAIAARDDAMAHLGERTDSLEDAEAGVAAALAAFEEAQADALAARERAEAAQAAAAEAVRRAEALPTGWRPGEPPDVRSRRAAAIQLREEASLSPAAIPELPQVMTDAQPEPVSLPAVEPVSVKDDVLTTATGAEPDSTVVLPRLRPDRASAPPEESAPRPQSVLPTDSTPLPINSP